MHATIRRYDAIDQKRTDELVQKKRIEPRRRAEGAAPVKQRAEDKGGVLAEYGLSEEQGNEIIMAARHAAGWFDDEPAAPAAATESEA